MLDQNICLALILMSQVVLPVKVGLFGIRQKKNQEEAEICPTCKGEGKEVPTAEDLERHIKIWEQRGYRRP